MASRPDIALRNRLRSLKLQLSREDPGTESANRLGCAIANIDQQLVDYRASLKLRARPSRRAEAEAELPADPPSSATSQGDQFVPVLGVADEAVPEPLNPEVVAAALDVDPGTPGPGDELPPPEPEAPRGAGSADDMPARPAVDADSIGLLVGLIDDAAQAVPPPPGVALGQGERDAWQIGLTGMFEHFGWQRIHWIAALVVAAAWTFGGRFLRWRRHEAAARSESARPAARSSAPESPIEPKPTGRDPLDVDPSMFFDETEV